MQFSAGGTAVAAEKPKHGGKREGSGRPRTERKDKAVKIDRVIADKAFVVAKARGITITEFLSDLFRGPVDKAYAQVVRDLDKRESRE